MVVYGIGHVRPAPVRRAVIYGCHHGHAHLFRGQAGELFGRGSDLAYQERQRAERDG